MATCQAAVIRQPILLGLHEQRSTSMMQNPEVRSQELDP
jgi:hypothetical protein